MSRRVSLPITVKCRIGKPSIYLSIYLSICDGDAFRESRYHVIVIIMMVVMVNIIKVMSAIMIMFILMMVIHSDDTICYLSILCRC